MLVSLEDLTRSNPDFFVMKQSKWARTYKVRSEYRLFIKGQRVREIYIGRYNRLTGQDSNSYTVRLKFGDDIHYVTENTRVEFEISKLVPVRFGK